MADNHSADYYIRNKERIQLAAKHRRKSHVAATVLADLRKTDRKRGRETISPSTSSARWSYTPVHTAENQELRITLDRVDNAIGHLQTNVVPACERCNFVRRDMPYEAWLVIAVAMKDARERGLFGDWTCAIHRRHALLPVPPLPVRQQPAHGTYARYNKCGPPRCADCKRAMRDWKRARRKLLRDATGVAGRLSIV